MTLQLFEHLSQPIVLINPDGGIKYLNSAAKHLLNVTDYSEELNLVEVIENISLIKSRKYLIEILESVNQTKQKKVVVIKDKKHQELTLKFIPDELGIIVEITTRSYSITLEQEIFNFVVENSSDMIFFKREDLAYEYANKTYLRFLNVEKSDLLGLTDEELVSKGVLSPIFQYQCSKSDAEVIKQGNYSNVEFFTNQNYYQISKRKMNKGILCVARDITNEINAYQEVEIDSVTSLYNRKALARILKSIPKDKEYHVIGIILENFGELSKDHGLLLGKRCLKQLAQFVRDYSDILFFHVAGIGFIGLFDKLLSNPELFQQSFASEVAKLNLPSILKTEIVIEKVNLESGFLAAFIDD